MGALLDIGDATPEPSPPEVEDHGFKTANIRHIDDLGSQQFIELMQSVCDQSIETAFGHALQPVGKGYAADEGCGKRSLAVVRAQNPPTLYVDGFRKLRIYLPDLDPAPHLSVADVRFVEPDHKTIRTTVWQNVNKRLEAGIEAFLMLGLPRATTMPSDDRSRHWLQLNGLCLVDDPVGDTP